MGLARIKKGDLVVVISGKDAGKQGKVLRVWPDDDKVTVEKVNLKKRHTKPSQQNQDGGIVEKEQPIHACKVMPIDPGTGRGTRVKTRVEPDKSKVRVGKSGKVIEPPPAAQ